MSNDERSDRYARAPFADTLLDVIGASGDYLSGHATERPRWRERVARLDAALVAAREAHAADDLVRAIELAIETLRARLAATEHGSSEDETTRALLDADAPLSYLRVRQRRVVLVQIVAGIATTDADFAEATSVVELLLNEARSLFAKIRTSSDDELLVRAVKAQIAQTEHELAAARRAIR